MPRHPHRHDSRVGDQCTMATAPVCHERSVSTGVQHAVVPTPSPPRRWQSRNFDSSTHLISDGDGDSLQFCAVLVAPAAHRLAALQHIYGRLERRGQLLVLHRYPVYTVEEWVRHHVVDATGPATQPLVGILHQQAREERSGLRGEDGRGQVRLIVQRGGIVVGRVAADNGERAPARAEWRRRHDDKGRRLLACLTRTNSPRCQQGVDEASKAPPVRRWAVPPPLAVLLIEQHLWRPETGRTRFPAHAVLRGAEHVSRLLAGGDAGTLAGGEAVSRVPFPAGGGTTAYTR